MRPVTTPPNRRRHIPAVRKGKRHEASPTCHRRITRPHLCKAQETFTGSILGRSGTVDFLDLISIDPTTGAVQGSFVSVGGTGGLSGLHTHGTFTAQGTSGSYSATVVFTP